jgi:hypothetical protein
MKLKWPILIAIIVLWICGTVGLLLHINFASTPTPSGAAIPTVPSGLIESVKIVLLMLGGLGVVLPTYLNVWQSLENNKMLEEKLRFDKVENSYKLIERWDTSNLFEARRFTRELKAAEKDLSPNQLIEKVEGNPKLKESVILVFNYWDGVRVSIKEQRVDAEVLRKVCRTAFCDMYKRFSPWIETQEQSYQNDLKELHDMWK